MEDEVMGWEMCVWKGPEGVERGPGGWRVIINGVMPFWSTKKVRGNWVRDNSLNPKARKIPGKVGQDKIGFEQTC
jgi:hypothetical protein